MRIYRVTLSPSDLGRKATFQEAYDEYVHDTKVLVSEAELIRLLGAGRVLDAKCEGILRESTPLLEDS